MENIDKIKCVLIDFENNDKNLNEAANEILRLFSVSKRFLVTYSYTNRTDAALHEDEVEARNCVEACNKVCANHNYEVEWHTVKEVS